MLQIWEEHGTSWFWFLLSPGKFYYSIRWKNCLCENWLNSCLLIERMKSEPDKFVSFNFKLELSLREILKFLVWFCRELFITFLLLVPFSTLLPSSSQSGVAFCIWLLLLLFQWGYIWVSSAHGWERNLISGWAFQLAFSLIVHWFNSCISDLWRFIGDFMHIGFSICAIFQFFLFCDSASKPPSFFFSENIYWMWISNESFSF